jgi:hypothetical protein
MTSDAGLRSGGGNTLSRPIAGRLLRVFRRGAGDTLKRRYADGVPGRGKPAGKDLCQRRRAKDYDWLSESRILLYDDPGMIPADLSVLVGKVRTLCRV